MSGTRGGIGRIVAMGIGLAVALLLLAAGEARAGKYEVAQCGWGVGADADWADTTGGKFRAGSYCVPPPGSGAFDGIYMKSLTAGGYTSVGGTQFARWRWTAPPGTGITKVRGTWWHVLHDGMRQRLGGVDGGGNFNMFAEATDTDTALRDFVAGFSSPAAAFQDRLLCAKSEGKWCSYDPASWSALRALTLTIEDDAGPAAGVGGELTAGGWRRGGQGIQVWGSDTGAGIRYGETTLDGNRVALTEYDCAKTMIGGEWLGTRMRPCETGVSASQSVATTTFSDGPHALAHCVTDFAGNVGCTPGQTVLIDNNAPAHVRDLALAGGEGWRRANDFDLSWANPDQGPASPVGGALWRVTGPAGYDTGVQFAAGRGLAALSDVHVPGPGAYSLQVWLRDEAGNDAPATATAMPLRFDDVAPGVAFEATAETGVPAQLQADVFDAHSGPAGGTIFYRRIDSSDWTELPTKLQPGATADAATLVARVPVDDLTPGVYLFRADAVDGAGNVASTTRRSDGTEMAARRPAPSSGGGGSSGIGLLGAERDPDRRQAASRQPPPLRPHRPLRRPRHPHRAPHPRRRRRPRRPRPAGDPAPLLRRDRQAERDRRPHRPGGRLPPQPAPGSLAPRRRRLRRGDGTGAGDPGAARPAGAHRRRPARHAARPAHRPGAATLRPGQRPRRPRPATRQAGRDPVLRVADPPLAPGSRHPLRLPRPLPRPLPLPLRHRHGPDQAEGDRPRRGALALRPRRLPPGGRPRPRLIVPACPLFLCLI